MHGIVSLLDDAHYQQVEALWAELRREFGVQGVYITPYPHFSYHVASRYNLKTLEPLLYAFTSEQMPFHVKTTGLGIFTGQQPVLYLSVVRSPQLTQFHQALWQRLVESGQANNASQDYYSPDNWMPHITIGFGDVDCQMLTNIVHYLGTRSFNWNIFIDNIALIYDTGTAQQLRTRIPLNSAKGFDS